MSNVNIIRDDYGVEQTPETKKFMEVYDKLVDDLVVKLGEIPDARKISSAYVNYESTRNGIAVSINIKDYLGVSTVRIVREMSSDGGTLDHSLMALSDKVQGQGISNVVNKASLDLLDSFGVGKITLNANIDAGGYVWLRKGFFPDGGADVLREIVNKSRSTSDALKSKFAQMSDAQIRNFVLTPEFRDYQGAFLNSTWDGHGVSDDKVVRSKILGTPIENAEPVKKSDLPNAITTASKATKQAVKTLGVANGSPDVLDSLLSFTLDLNRFDTHVRSKVSSILTEAQYQVATRLSSSDPLTTYTRARLTTLLGQIDKALGTTMSKLNNIVLKDLTDVARVSAVSTASALESQVPGSIKVNLPSENVFKAIVDDKLILGAPAADWWIKLGTDTSFRYSQAIRQGVTLGETNSQIVKRVVDATNIVRRNARTLVQTSISSIANHARQETFTANNDLISKYKWISALDSLVCNLCLARADKEWDVNNKPLGHNIPFQVPGVHFNDRCVITAITKSWKELGFDNIKEPKAGKRASVDGPVDSSMTLDKFLRSKSKSWQDETLGKGRVDLWRSNKITLEQLIDGTGKPLTIKQLQSKYGSK